MNALAWCSAPAASRKERSRFTMVFPRHFMTSLFVFVTLATTTAFKFSLLHAFIKASLSFARTTTAILS